MRGVPENEKAGFRILIDLLTKQGFKRQKHNPRCNVSPRITVSET
jgi:hypothetical protein